MKPITIALTALALIAGSAQAQNDHARSLALETRGVSMSGHTILATGVTIEGPGVRGSIATGTGQGVGLQIGYGFTRQLAAFANADLSRQKANAGYDGSMGLARLELGARFALLKEGSRSAPYLSAHVGMHALGARSEEGGLDEMMRISGTQAGAGAGILYALSSSIALDAGVVGDYGKFGKLELTGPVNGTRDVAVNSSTTIRVKVGFAWHP
jgi:hypothetical protein